ncbi:MAG: Alcohol dehydrogenase zinc-binding domain protein [Candidatus Gallionella acididurans]|uniref:Alcohol dehydrogenase zinc-binding domain protein n=1 Tax=Candidatus Gallionella acididurans TaxID=1796491 RepID=A0A139BUR1_9PROT|nr:MAG: Alcohol dehydrogenase zinc-binding domain protein [Candidatus Gallionella acididurans]
MTHAIQIHQAGGPEVLQWEQVEVGAPGVGQVRLKQTAVGLNYIDVYHRTGLYPLPLPFVPGMEAAGIVESVGGGVSYLKPGDRVAYASAIGAYAEARLIAADRVVKLPEFIDDRTAAAMMLQGMTARYLIRDIYKVGPGDTILIHAAAGGVGLIVCQWAAALGATVIGTVSSDEKAALARANGCHHPIIYTREDFQARLLEITGGEKLAVVYDSVGKDTFMKSLDCLRPRGLMVLFGSSSGPVPPLDLTLLSQKGSLLVTRPTLATFVATKTLLEENSADLFDAVGSGKVKIHVNQSYRLKDTAQAHRDLEARKTTGSTVLTV